MGKSQKRLISEADWDTLIVLDACRFDLFEEVYSKYLNGDLRKVESSGGATLEWLKNTFRDDNDYIYYSANPYVNSKSDEYDWGFGKVYDAWLKAWDDKYGTVLPADMTEYVLNNGQSEQRKIIHYIQPHVPFIGLGKIDGYFKNKDKAMGDMELRKIRSFLGKIANKLIGVERMKKIREKLGLRVNSYDVIRKRCDYDDSVVREKYKNNLELALKSVSYLVSELEGRTVITSDHGEMLGEGGKYGHFENENHPTLKNVPWLVVE